MKNKSVKKSLEVKECSRKKAQKSQAKNLHETDRQANNNCYELRSRAINNNLLTRQNINHKLYSSFRHNRLNVGRIALELVGALINCNLLQSGGGG